MQKATQKITEQNFNRLFIEVIDETFSSLGESAKTAIYFHLERKFKIKKDEIPNTVANFAQAMDILFGISSKPLELMFMQRLNEKVKAEYGSVKPDDFTFEKYVDMVKQKVVSTDKAEGTATSFGDVGWKNRQEREDDFIALLNLIADPVVVVDPRGNFLFINTANEKETGISREEWIGKSFMSSPNFPLASKKLLMENLKKRNTGFSIVPYEVDLVGVNGEIKQFEINAKNIDYAGQPAILVISRDVTLRKKTETQLRDYADKLEWLVSKKAGEIIESEAKLRGIFESSPDAVLVLDQKDAIVECNQAALKTFN